MNGWNADRSDTDVPARTWTRQSPGGEVQHLHVLLQQCAQQRPTQVALKTPAHSFTFAQMHIAVRDATTELTALGIAAGDVVAFQLPNWNEAFVLYHAIVGLGAVALPLLPALRDRDLTYMLHETQTRLFVTPASWRGVDHAAMALRVCGAQVLTAVLREPHEHGPLLRAAGAGQAREAELMLERRPPAALAAEQGGPAGSLDAVCSMIFTSGTSGRPKAVLYTHRSLGAEGREMCSADGIGAEDVLFVPPAIGHVSGIAFGVYAAMHAGATVCLLPEWNADHAIALIARERCTWTAGATPFLQGLVDATGAKPGALGSLRVFRCGGASVPPSLIRQARALGVDAYRSYGLSEHPTVSGHAGQPDAVCIATDGAVHPRVEVRIVDPQDARRDRGVGEEGEILTRGPDLSIGYLRVADTQAARSEGWLLTGDLGILSADGVLRVTGRKKDIIIRKGENISAREIEDLLAEHPAVADVAVVGAPDPERGEMVCCVVVGKTGAPPSLQELCRHLRAHGLTAFKLPERLVLLPQLPYNVGGKVLKSELRAMLARGAGQDHGQAVQSPSAPPPVSEWSPR